MTSLIQVSESNAIIYISTTSFFGELQTIRDIGGTRNSSNTITISTLFADGTSRRIIDTPYASLTLNPSTGTIVHEFPLSYNASPDIPSLTVATYAQVGALGTNIFNSLYVQDTISITGIDSTVDILIGCNSAAKVPNLLSTVKNLGNLYLSTIYYVPIDTLQSNGYIYNTDFYSTIAGLPYVSTASLQSTFNGLGRYGYVSTAGTLELSNTYITYSNLQSTVGGLGRSKYISTSYLVSTTVGFSNSIYSPSITSIYTSTVTGLGSSKYISRGDLVSTVQGLGSNYISTGGLTSTVGGILNSILFPSTVAGLGQIYISTPQLTSTVTGIFSNNSVALQSTVNGLGKTYISTGHLISTVDNLGQLYVSTASLVAAVSNLGEAGFIKNTNLVSTVQGLGRAGYLGTTGYISTSGLTTSVSNVSASNSTYYINVINSLGSNGYISTASLVSTVNGLGSNGYISTSGLTSFVLTEKGSHDTQTQLTSSIMNLGSKGFITRAALVSTTTYYNNLTIYSLDSDYVLTNPVLTVAGSTPGSNNGPVSSATFSIPTGVAFDSSGNIIVADRGNNLIRKIYIEHTVTTFAGSTLPKSVAIDSSGNVYTSDYDNNVVNKITKYGVVSPFAYVPMPRGIVIDSSDNVYILCLYPDENQETIIFKFASDGGGLKLYRFGDDQSIPFAHYNPFTDIAFDSSENIYVSSSNYGVFKITPSQFAYGYYGHSAITSGLGTSLEGIAVDSAGKIYVSDTANHKIFTIDPAFTSATLFAGTGVAGSNDAPVLQATFSFPRGISIDSAGNIYVADSGNNKIRKISNGIVTTFAGTGVGSSVDGIASSASFSQPWGVRADSTGSVYVADYANNTIRKIFLQNLLNAVTTLAGSGSASFADGQGTLASFNNPEGLVCDSSGNTYVADYGNRRIRKITSSGLVTTFAGTGAPGSNNDKLSNSSFRAPVGITFDYTGNIMYVADEHKIRKLDLSSSNVYTYAGGSLSGFANGIGGAAKFYSPNGLACDSAGNVYVADTGNNRIRKIELNSNVTTLAGSNAAAGAGSGFANGQGCNAYFNSPQGIKCDLSGNLYIGDTLNNRIRKIDTNLNVTTLAGSNAGFADGLSSNALFDYPFGLELNSGNIYVADYNNNRIRKIATDIFTTIAYGLSNTYINNAAMTSTITGLGQTYVSSLTTAFKNAVGGATSIASYIPPANIVSTFTDINNINFIPLTQTQLVSTSTGIQTNLTGSNNSTSSMPITIEPLYTFVNLYAGTGSSGGSVASVGALSATFGSSTYLYIAYNSLNDKLFIGDAANSRIRYITTNGLTVTEFYNTGLNSITFDNNGNLYITVLDSPNFKLYKYNSGNSIPVSTATLIKTWANTISGIATDSAGNIYVINATNHTVEKYNSSGTLINASLITDTTHILNDTITTQMAIDLSGNIYIACRTKNVIQKYNSSGLNVATIGNGTMGFDDNTIYNSKFNNPTGVACDSLGNVYIADTGNNRIRKVCYNIYGTVGDVITIVGSGTPGSSYGTGLYTTLNAPTYLAIDPRGNLYITDSGNYKIARVQMKNKAYTYTANPITAVNSIAFQPGSLNVITKDIYSYCNIQASYFYARQENGGNGYYYADGTLLYNGSDRRLKQDIVPLSNAIENILKVSGVSYTRKDDKESKRQIGFIAQDVEAVFPELIFTDESVDKNKSIKYDSMNVILLEAIKELDIQCDELLNTLSSNI